MKKLREKCKNKKGFTMVELIVVIVIILVLAAVLVPSLLKYVDKANKANCKADAATIMSQLQADLAGSQALDGDDSVTVPTQIGNVKVSPNTVGFAAVNENEAVYMVDANGEMSKFGYNNGKYTAIWTVSDGWDVEKNS